METGYLIFSYLLGTLPTGLVLSKLKGIDITSIGSGNVGATNVARALGKKFGILTLLIDISKGSAAVLIACLLGFRPELIYLSGVCAVFGHCFSIPKILPGGKGVATAFGVTIAISPLVAALAFLVFLISYKLSRIVSLSSLAACSALPVITLLRGNQQLAVYFLIIAITIIYKHRSNIRKLLAGEEKKFNAS